MRHEAEDPASGVADAGDGIYRAVGIGRIVLRRVTILGVTKYDQVVSLCPVHGLAVGRKSTLAVSDWQSDFRPDASSKQARAAVSYEVDPSTLETRTRVGGKRGLMVPSVRIGNRPVRTKT
jgi:hypothetical protein